MLMQHVRKYIKTWRVLRQGSQWFKNVGVLEPLRPPNSFLPTGLTGYIIADAPLCGLALTGNEIGRGSFFIRGKPCIHTDLGMMMLEV